MAETLNVTDMLPRTFSHVRKYRWIVAVDGIDAFLTRGKPDFTTRGLLDSPPLVFPLKLDEILIANGIKNPTVDIVVWDSIAPTAFQRFLSWIRGKEERCSKYEQIEQIQLKMMDPLGSVINIIQLDGVKLLSHSWGEYKYESAEVVDMSVKISYDTMTETL